MAERGEQVCFIYELLPGAEAEYERRHRSVWPDLLERFREAGVSDYSIFRRGTLLISVLTATPDWPTVRERIRASPVDHRWSAEQRHLFVRVADEDGNELYAERVFRFDG